MPQDAWRTQTSIWIPSLSLLRKSVVRLTDRLDMTMAVDWDIKQHIPENISFQGLYIGRITPWKRKTSFSQPERTLSRHTSLSTERPI